MPGGTPGTGAETYRRATPPRQPPTLLTRFYPTAVIPLCKRIDRHLIRWAKRKYKRLERGDKRAWAWLAAVTERAPGLFAHWKYCATA